MSTMIAPSVAELKSRLDAAAQAVDYYQFEPASQPALQQALRDLAETLGQLTKREHLHPLLPRVLEVTRAAWNSGLLGTRAPEENLAATRRLLGSNWPGLLGAMLLVPYWQWDESIALDEVPDWLWAHFVQWAFVPSCVATEVGAADRQLHKLEQLAEDLNTWAGRNRAAACVEAALNSFEKYCRHYVPQRSTLPLRNWMSVRAKVYARWRHHRGARTTGTPLLPRQGRSLKVGVILSEWSDTLEARTVLPWISALDPTSFSLELFAETSKPGGFQAAVARSFGRLFTFPPRLEDRLTALRKANLDILVYAGPLAHQNEFQLALHRIAPLQVVLDGCSHLAGLPDIELHLTGSPGESDSPARAFGHFRSPGWAWDAETAPAAFELADRAKLGLRPTGQIFVSAPQLAQLSPEILQAWSSLLKAEPESSLLLLLPPSSDTFVLEQVFSRLTATTGLEPGRIVISLGDPRTALPLGDVYLDTYPQSAPASFLAALAAGLPTVVWKGHPDRSQTAASILSHLDQSSPISVDPADYVARARQLCREAAQGQQPRTGLSGALDLQLGLRHVPYFGQQFGLLLARAYDELAERGALSGQITLPTPSAESAALENMARDALTRKDPRMAAQHAGWLLLRDPRSAAACSILGQASLLAGKPGSAVTFCLAALQGHEQESAPWFELGAAFLAANDPAAADTAYQAALRRDPMNLDGWFALAELATKRGRHDVAEQALCFARRIDPKDPRLAAFD